MDLARAIAAIERDGLGELAASTQWQDADVTRFETETGLALPRELAAFLKSHGKLFLEFLVMSASFDGGRTQNTEVERIGGGVDQLITDSQRFLEQRNRVTGDVIEPARSPEGYIHIGEAEGKRSRLLMDGVNPDNNAVYIWGIAFDPWGEGDNTLGLGYVADSLSDWIIHLSQNPDG